VNDLREHGELDLAQRIAGHYMVRLDSGELRFNYLTITVKLGYVERAMDQLEESLETNQWFSPWFLQRTPELQQLGNLPRFQRILKSCKEKETQYWQNGVMTPILQVPPSAQPPFPLIIAMHGNGFNSQHSASHWSAAVDAGWMVFHPLAKRLVGYGLHWWDIHEENREIIAEQAGKIFTQYPIDTGRVILGGFSKGGETAMVLALLGKFGAKGFITIGAGGYYHMQPELWQPLLESPPPGLRGVAMYSPYDLERNEGSNHTLEMMQAAGIEVRMEKYYGEGHVFPEDFAVRFQSAIEFVMGSSPAPK
jgi:pimeloyl-ACP methyl ester carboxylesterase